MGLPSCIFQPLVREPPSPSGWLPEKAAVHNSCGAERGSPPRLLVGSNPCLAQGKPVPAVQPDE